MRTAVSDGVLGSGVDVERLRAVVDRARRAPIYQSLQPARHYGDLAALPFTTKETLRQVRTVGDVLAVPSREVRRWHASSGSTGRRTAMAYTAADLEAWGEVLTGLLTTSGVDASCTVHNAFGYGLFTGGLGFHGPLERLGAAVVPVGGASSVEENLALMAEFDADVLLCLPSTAARLAHRATHTGWRGSLRIGIFGGESWSSALRRRICDRLGIDALDTYGLSEVIGPGVAHECSTDGGLHVFSDRFWVELIDGRGVPVHEPGVAGELVITTTFNEACPRLRYRSGDWAELVAGACRCGDRRPRIRLLGRQEDVIATPAGNVWLTELEAGLLSTLPDAAGPDYRFVIDEQRRVVRVEIESETDQCVSAVAAQLSERFGIAPVVERAPLGSLERAGKAQRIVRRGGAAN